MSSPRLLVVDDHGVFREALVQVLSAHERIGACIGAADLPQAAAAVARGGVDLAIVDLRLPGVVPPDAVRSLRRAAPTLPLVVLSMLADPCTVSAALRAGARGYVAKTSAFGTLVEAVAAVAGGARFVDPALGRGEGAAAPAAPRLSGRELEVLRLTADGLRPSEIAQRLQLSVQAVSTYKARLKDKLGLRSDAEIVRYAMLGAADAARPRPG